MSPEHMSGQRKICIFLILVNLKFVRGSVLRESEQVWDRPGLEVEALI